MYVEKDDILFTDKGGGITQRMLGWKEQLMAVEMTFKKGAYVAPHCHDKNIQCIYIVRGSFEITCGDRKVSAKPGDCFYADYGEMHGTLCLEDDSVLLDIHTPMRPDILAEGLEYRRKNGRE